MMGTGPYDAPPGYSHIGKIESARVVENVLHLPVSCNTGDSAHLTFELIDRFIWRWTIVPSGTGTSLPTTIVSRTSTPSQPVILQTHGGSQTLTGGELTLALTGDPWSFAFIDRDGNRVLRDNPGDVDGLGRPFVPPLGFVRDATGVVCIFLRFHLAADEHLFGTGEKFTRLDKMGQRIVSWTQDAFGSTSERSHKNIPFLLSTRGYGLLLDTGARITWDLGVSSCQSATIAVEASSLTCYLISGDTPATILSRYAELTGSAPLPPKWSFGLWVSSGGTYRDRSSMEALVNGLEKHRIPADVVHVDPWWMKWRTYCDFRWDEEAFPDPVGFIRWLHDRELKLCLWEHPYISIESDLFDVGREKGFLVRRPDGEVYVIDYGLSLAPRPDGVVREATPENSWNARVAIVDMTNAEARAWFQNLHRPVLRMGVDVFKTDFGEDIPADACFADGRTGRELHNLYPLLYNEAVAEVTREVKGNGMVWGRAGTAGSQRTPVCWSGDPAADFESLACTVRGGLSIGFSGIPFWSNDIGGYRGMPDPTLFVRWAQFGLFCSHSRMHGDSPREPWQFGEEALSIVRRYVVLRYQLFPYLYSCAHEAQAVHLPVLRAMPLAFPDDPNTFDKDLQYMLGPWLLVAPIVTRTGRRTVYLPPGRWYDFWSGAMHRGPLTLKIGAPLDMLPLFVREGAVIPMMPPADRIPAGLIDPLIVDIYPSSESDYVFREDEGDTHFRWRMTSNGYALEWSGPTARAWDFRIHRDPEAGHVRSAEIVGTGKVAIRDMSDTVVQIQTGILREGRMVLG